MNNSPSDTKELSMSRYMANSLLHSHLSSWT